MRISRLIQIIILLSGKSDITARYLAQRFDVSRKTIYKDLDMLITSGIPIVYGENTKGYIEILDGYKFNHALGLQLNVGNDNGLHKEKTKDLYIKHIDNEPYNSMMDQMWEGFVNKRKVDTNKIKPEILHSWVRCQQMNLSIHEIDQSNMLPPCDMAKYDVENILKDQALNTQLLSELAKKLNWYISIYDMNYQLKYIINPIEKYDQIYPQVGYNKDASEEIIGTNAVHISINEGRGVMVMGSEHYKTTFHQISCVAVPLYYNYEIVGALNIAFIHKKTNPMIIEHIKSYARFYETLVLHSYDDEMAKERDLQARAYKDTIDLEEKAPDLWGESKHWKDVMHIADHMSKVQSHMAIIGDKGVGKTALAKYIHYNSPRRYGPVTVCDCRDFVVKEANEALFGSEVEGNESVGLIERANGGSVILKHVEVLQAMVIKKLEHFIDRGTIRRKGSNKTHRFDVKLFFIIGEGVYQAMPPCIRSTFAPLSISIKALSHRKEDVGAIASQYLSDFFKAQLYSRSDLKRLIVELEKMEWEENVNSLLHKLDEIKAQR